MLMQDQREEYTKLLGELGSVERYPLFGDEGTSKFDNIDLRTSQNYSWAFQGNGNNTFLREVFARDTQRDMGQAYTRSRYVHLYLNENKIRTDISTFGTFRFLQDLFEAKNGCTRSAAIGDGVQAAFGQQQRSAVGYARLHFTKRFHVALRRVGQPAGVDCDVVGRPHVHEVPLRDVVIAQGQETNPELPRPVVESSQVIYQ